MGSFNKRTPYKKLTFLNGNNTQDTTIGGTITTAPPGYSGGQGQQNFPGDRIFYGPADAFAASNNAVGNLYTGSYRYVAFRNNSTSNPTRGRGVFWDPTAGGLTGNNISSMNADAAFMVTSDGNAANYAESLFAGVALMNISLNNGTGAYWWIQESGKASCQFRAAISGTPSIGVGVYLPLTPPANNNATDNGAFDQLTGANSAAIFTANSVTGYTTIDQMINNYVGVAETLPSNNNIALVDLQWAKVGYRPSEL